MDNHELLLVAKELNNRLSRKTEIRENYAKSSIFTEDFFKCLEDVYTNCNIESLQGVEVYNNGTYESEKRYLQREKLTIDMIIWKAKYNKGTSNISRYIWKYDTIIEHENNGFDWLHEFQKLCSISADKKLLITYGKAKKGIDGIVPTIEAKGVNLLETAQELLDFVGNKSFSEFVIMFGEELTNFSMNSSEDIYDIYYYDGSHFVQYKQTKY